MQLISKAAKLKNAVALFKSFFPKSDFKIYILIIITQIITATLDIFGILLVGLVSTLAASYVLNQTFNNPIYNLLSVLNLETFSTRSLIFSLSLLTLLFFVVKSILSIYANRLIVIYYGKKQAEFSTNLFSNLLNSSYVWLRKQNYEDIHAAVIVGVDSIYVRVIGNVILVISDLLLLILVLIFLIFYNPAVTFFTFCYLLLFAIALQRLVGNRALTYGEQNSMSSINSHRFLNIAFSSFKDVFVMAKSQDFKRNFQLGQSLKSISSAKGLWIQQLPKYIFEIALTIGIFLLSFFLLVNTLNNISVLMVFLVASSRLVPAIFRIQSGIIGTKLGFPHALKAIKLSESLQKRENFFIENTNQVLQNPPRIEIKNVSFQFPDASDFVLNNINIEIEPGEIIAVVGESGSGKTTLVDLILNIYSPDSGAIKIKDGSTEFVPGITQGIGYVPQHPLMFSGSLLENITFGSDANDISSRYLAFAIRHANLADVIEKLPSGLYTDLSNIGSFLSGGEKQRIALARALYTNPKLLVIDEGTSSLDYSSEKLITDSLLSLSGKMTIIVIAHRLNSIRNVNKIYFIEAGRIQKSGNFFELQKSVPKFAEWIKSMQSDN